MKVHEYHKFRKVLPNYEIEYDFSGVEIGDAVSFAGSALFGSGKVVEAMWHGMYSLAVYKHAMKLGEGSGPAVYSILQAAIPYVLVVFAQSRPEEVDGLRRFDLEAHEQNFATIETIPFRISQMITP